VRKPFCLLALCLCLVGVPCYASETDITPLSNKDVLVMVQNHVSEETIIKAIKSSPCTFDTFPPVLKDMKRRGVSDAVLMAMVEAPYGPVKSVPKDELGSDDQPIYHYADQLRQMGYLVPSTVNPTTRFPRQSMRASRNRRQ
jgi:hypothetical protein